MIKVIAIGDVHAEFDRLWEALRAAYAADADGLPTPPVREGRYRVVLLGDLVHPKSLEGYRRLTGLEDYDPKNPDHLRAASLAQVSELLRVKRYLDAARGHAVVLLGNHDHAALHHDVLLGNAFGVEHREFDPKYGGRPLPPGLARWIASWPKSYELLGVQFAHAGPTPWLQSYDPFFYQSREAKTWWRETPEYVRRSGFRFGVYGHTPVDEIVIDRKHGFAIVDALDRGQYLELLLDDDRLEVRPVTFAS